MSAVLFLCLSNWVYVSVLLLGRSLRPVSSVLVCVCFVVVRCYAGVCVGLEVRCSVLFRPLLVIPVHLG